MNFEVSKKAPECAIEKKANRVKRDKKLTKLWAKYSEFCNQSQVYVHWDDWEGNKGITTKELFGKFMRDRQDDRETSQDTFEQEISLLNHDSGMRVGNKHISGMMLSVLNDKLKHEKIDDKGRVKHIINKVMKKSGFDKKIREYFINKNIYNQRVQGFQFGLSEHKDHEQLVLMRELGMPLTKYDLIAYTLYAGLHQLMEKRRVALELSELREIVSSHGLRLKVLESKTANIGGDKLTPEQRRAIVAKVILSSPDFNREELARKLKVTSKTIQRDLRLLDMVQLTDES